MYEFKNSDACKDMSQKEFFGILDVVDVNLFVAVARNKKDFANIDEFLEEYEKVELGYNSYIDVYCGGDRTKVDTDKYAQFFGSALELEEFGDVGGDSSFKGLNDVSDINREYYDVYGKADAPKDINTGFFHKLSERVKNVFKSSRRSDYNDMTKTLKAMQQEKDNTKDMGEMDNGER